MNEYMCFLYDIILQSAVGYIINHALRATPKGPSISSVCVRFGRRGQKWRPNAPSQTQITSALRPHRRIYDPNLRPKCVGTDAERTLHAPSRYPPRPHMVAVQLPAAHAVSLIYDDGPTRQRRRSSFFKPTVRRGRPHPNSPSTSAHLCSLVAGKP